MSWLKNLFTKIDDFFHSPAIEAAEQEVEKLLPVGIQIVQEINALAPNKTLTELNTIATKYAIPTITSLASGQTVGNVALNLGTQILAKNHAPAAATSLLNTVIQTAVFAVNNGGVPSVTAPAPAAS